MLSPTIGAFLHGLAIVGLSVEALRAPAWRLRKGRDGGAGYGSFPLSTLLLGSKYGGLVNPDESVLPIYMYKLLVVLVILHSKSVGTVLYVHYYIYIRDEMKFAAPFYIDS
jgi:hypothetical protein